MRTLDADIQKRGGEALGFHLHAPYRKECSNMGAENI